MTQRAQIKNQLIPSQHKKALFFFTVRVVKHWNKLHEVVMEILKTQLDADLSDL